MTRLEKIYTEKVVPALQKEFNYKSPMQTPAITKISLNIGLGAATQNNKLMEEAVAELTAIAGQKAVVTRAKKSIANFKVREGQPIGARVTLRKDLMWDFLDKLMNFALPRVRDFRGIPDRGFDGRGNFTLGIKEHTIFPEMEADRGIGDDPEFLDTVDPRVVRGTDYPDGEIETPGALAEVADEHFFGRFLVRYGLERVARGREEDCRRVGLAGGDGRVDSVDVLEVAVAAEVPVDPCEKRLGRDGLQDMQQDRREAREDHRTPVQEFGGEEAVAFLYGEQQGAHVQQEGILVRIQVLDGGRYEYRDFRL